MGDVVEYNNLTVKALKDLMAKRGVTPTKTRPKKVDLIAALRADDRRQGTQCPSPDNSPPVTPGPSRRPSMSRSTPKRGKHSRPDAPPEKTFSSATSALIALMAVAVTVLVGFYIWQPKVPRFVSVDTYTFIADQDDANEAIRDAISMWTMKDEPDTALSLHLAGGNFDVLKDVAHRVHHALQHMGLPSKGYHDLTWDYKACVGQKDPLGCLRDKMAGEVHRHKGHVVFYLDARDIDFENNLAFLTAITDDSAAFIKHPTAGQLQLNNVALLMLSDFAHEEMPRLTGDSDTDREIARKSFDKNKRLMDNARRGTCRWSDRFYHRIHSHIPVLSKDFGKAES